MPVCEADSITNSPRGIRARSADGLSLWKAVCPPHVGRLILARRKSPLLQQIMNSTRPLIFPALWLFIGLVSAIDTYVTIRFQEWLWHLETNPLARMLLRLDGWNPSLLIASKFFGSILVLGSLLVLHLQNRRVGLLVTAALASFQLWLLGYLALA